MISLTTNLIFNQNLKLRNMLHEPVVEIGTDKAASRKAKLGVKMFIAYTLIYAGFVLIGLTKPELMGLKVLGEQNLAIIYGFGLILLAIIMGFIYNYFCTKLENKLNKN
jgi:uncharacterized membrane protein (DUF485 family)